jgi:tetratricopeptide (TPR) repeat protein
MTLAEVNMHLGRFEEARAQVEMAFTLACKISPKLYMPWAQMWLGWAALAEGKYSEAHHFFQESLANFSGWLVETRARALTSLGRAAYGLGNRSVAQQHLYEALGMAIKIKAFIPLLSLLPVISLLLADAAEIDQKERAMEVYALASSHPYVAKSRLFADIVGWHIAAVAATLPPEVVAAAQRRGRALDWWATAAELLEALQKLGWHTP